MAKTYQVIEKYTVDDFEETLNSMANDGYAVVSHSITYNTDNSNFLYLAIMVKYGRYSTEDHIEKIINKLDSIESNTSNIS